MSKAPCGWRFGYVSHKISKFGNPSYQRHKTLGIPFTLVALRCIEIFETDSGGRTWSPILQPMWQDSTSAKEWKPSIRGPQVCFSPWTFLCGNGKILAWTLESACLALRKGHDSIWVIVHRLTKVAHFIPVKIAYTTDKLADLYIDNILRLQGAPKTIVSDRGPQFIAKF